jgi:hypothetical protein
MFEIDEMWMRFEPCWPEAVLSYAGGRVAKRAPQIAISNMRPAHTSDRLKKQKNGCAACAALRQASLYWLSPE